MDLSRSCSIIFSSILRKGPEVILDMSKVRYQKYFMEAISSGNVYDYIYSIHVARHSRQVVNLRHVVKYFTV